MEKYRLPIIEIIDEAPNIKTFVFEKPKDFTWDEGAHIHMAINGYDIGEKVNKDLVRHLSISSLPNEDKLAVTTKFYEMRSQFKTALLEAGVGDEAIFFKVGSRLKLVDKNPNVVLLSMGVSIASMRPIILTYLEDKKGVEKLTNINVSKAGEGIYRKELDIISDDSFENVWIENRNDLTAYLEKMDFSLPTTFYITGSDLFLQNMINYLIGQGVTPDNIIIDKKDLARQEFFN